MSRRKREITGLTNERDFPHLVELALPPGGFRSVLLEIDAFHRDRRIPGKANDFALATSHLAQSWSTAPA